MAIFRRLSALFRRDCVDREIESELREHMQMRIDDGVAQGMSRKDAERTARLEFGNPAAMRERVFAEDAALGLESLLRDVGYALRGFVRNPGFAVVAILTLALSIGTNTAIFTVVNGILLKPLPYADPERLVMLWETSLKDGTQGTVAPANFYDWERMSHSFEKMAALDPYPDFILNGAGEAKRLTGAAVSQQFFSLLGTRMALGRDFLPEEDHPGTNHVAILSYASWQRYFGGRANLIGSAITLNNEPYTVVGVLPRDFTLVSKAADYQTRNHFDLWTPMGLPSPPEAWQRGTHSLCVFGRLKPGVTLKQAQADLDQVAANLQRLYPDEDKERGIAADPLAAHVIGGVRAVLYTLLGAVGMVLLLACANVANLMLTRGVARQREIALRVALGASRKRVARQLLTESVVLAAVSGLLGLVMLLAGLPALLRHLPADLPRAAEIGVDWRVLFFTGVLPVATALLFGMVPLMQFRRVDTQDALKQGGRGLVPDHSALRSGLIVAQVAIALMLLAGAGLMTKSLWRLMQVSPGFRTEHILTARLSLPPAYTNGYTYGIGRRPGIALFQQRLLERVRQIPGVSSAAFASYLPLSGGDSSWAFDIAGRPARPVGVYDVANYRPVSAGYFETVGIPVLHGRSFDEHDTAAAPLVAAINASAARRWWPGENPVGRQMRFENEPWRTIVGVVGDVHHDALNAEPEPEIYLPFAQAANVEARPTIVVRTSVAPESVGEALRKAVAEVDAKVPMDQVETMRQMVYGSTAQPRFRAAAVASFALLALFVASIGLYGVMSYSVSQRTREFGVRMAVGASRGAILRMVLSRAGGLVALGMCAGWIGAAMLTRLIASLLYDVQPMDVATLAGVSVLLAAVALIASYVPARRAAQIQPMESLRCE